MITEHLSKDRLSSHAVSTRRSMRPSEAPHDEQAAQLTEIDSDAENTQPNDAKVLHLHDNNDEVKDDPKDSRIRDLERQLETLHAFYRDHVAAVQAGVATDKNDENSLCHLSARIDLSNIFPPPANSFDKGVASATESIQGKLQHHQSLPVQLKSIDICDQNPDKKASDAVHTPQEEILHQVNPTPRVVQSPSCEEA